MSDAPEALRRGRGVGLGAKRHAYARQERGADTLDANTQLGLPVDSREYGTGAQILVSLGMAVGVGNIWRFPRVMAKFEGGGGTFLIPWAIFLFTWSIPLLVAESAIGRRTRAGVVASMKEILGRGGWIGSFVALCTCLITCYYAVLVGWCGIYVVESLRGEIGTMEVEPATARFEEAVADYARISKPAKDAFGEKWHSWQPDFASYDVVVLNYNGQGWPAPTRKAFVEYVRNGGGVLLVRPTA